MTTFDQQVKSTGKAGNFVYGILQEIRNGHGTVLITGSGQRLTNLALLSDNLEVGQTVIVDYSSGVPPFIRGHGTATSQEQKEVIVGLDSIQQDIMIEDVSASVMGRTDQIIGHYQTLLTFSTAVFDEYSMFDPYNPGFLLIPYEGVYYVTAQIIVEGIHCDYSFNNRVWMSINGSNYGQVAISSTHQYQYAPSSAIIASVQGVITAAEGELVSVSAWLDSSFGQNTADILPNHYGPYAALSPCMEIFKVGGGFYISSVGGLFTSEFPQYYDPPVIEIQGNTGYMYVTGELVYARAIAQTTKQSNQNLVTDFRFQEVEEGESYFSVFLKTSSDWLNWSTPTTGYELQISSTGGYSVWRYDAGIQTLLASHNTNATTAWQKLEFEVNGTSIKAKVWAKAGSEPSWQVDYTDGSPISSAGRMQLGHFNLSGARWCRIDNLTLTTP